MNFRIIRPDTAFAEPRKQRRPRKHEADHLTFIRKLPCLICGKRGCHAAHIRYADSTYFKRQVGISEKPDDKFCVPLCVEHHLNGEDAQHKHNEREWWAAKRIDPLAVAAELFVWSGDEEIGEAIIRRARA